MKKVLFGIIIGIILSGVTVYASTILNGKDILFDNTNNGMSSTNIQDAIEELYSIENTCISSLATFMNLGKVTTYDVATYFPSIYKNLTADNFLVEVNQASFSLGTVWNAGYNYGSPSTNISKTYDSETGTLTINSTGLLTGGTASNSSNSANFSISQQYSVYLVYFPGKSGIFTNLGSVSTFDAKESYPNDYQDMTESDFIVQLTSSSISFGESWAKGFDYGAAKATLNKSYDSETGIFTLTSLGGMAGATVSNSTNSARFGGTLLYDVYLAHRK